MKVIRLKVGLWLVRLSVRMLPYSPIRVKLCREFLDEVNKCGNG